jgi:hypothetical protein
MFVKIDYIVMIKMIFIELASQTAMAMIAKKLISTLAPILTYTMDEVIRLCT